MNTSPQTIQIGQLSFHMNEFNFIMNGTLVHSVYLGGTVLISSSGMPGRSTTDQQYKVSIDFVSIKFH